MENFSTTLKHRVVTLQTATEVARFSFIVRNSISYLDLELCEYSLLSDYLEASCDCCTLMLSKRFINTEEKCRKFFCWSRNLLYTWHLDLPKRRECSLKNSPYPTTFEHDPFNQHLGRIIPTCGFDLTILSDFLEEAMSKNNDKLKTLAWILKISFNQLPLLYILDIRIVNKCLDCLSPEMTDTTIFKDFIMNLDFSEWILEYEKPEILEFLLYYARQYGRKDMSLDDFPIDEIIDPCMLRRHFLNIAPILKYVNIPGFSEDDYYLYFDSIRSMRPNLTEEVLEKAEQWIKPERVHQMLQIIWLYIDCRQHHCTRDASEALRLIWCSVPDPFLSFKEIEWAFGEVLSGNELKNVYDFYVGAVGERYESVEPRSLQHLCRSIIRRTLWENEIWIPEGVRKMGLPKSFLSFLNLEKVFPSNKTNVLL